MENHPHTGRRSGAAPYHNRPPLQGAPGLKNKTNKGGGVPPLDAFDHLPKRQPPDLPGRVVGPPPGPMLPVPPSTGRGKNDASNKKRKSSAKKKKEASSQKAKRKKRPVNPAKRRRNRQIAAAFAMVVLIAAGVWYSISVLFKVENFAIENLTDSGLSYTEEEILAAFPRQKGDNMFGFTLAATQEEMEKRLPYADSIAIRRRLPNTVVFKIVPATEAFCMPWEGQFAVISSKNKVLRLAGEPQPGLVLIEGLIGVEPVPGQALGVSPKVLGVQAEQYTAALQAQTLAQAVPDSVALAVAALPESTLQGEGGPAAEEQPDPAESLPAEPLAESTPVEPPPVEPPPVEGNSVQPGPMAIPTLEPEALLEEANLRLNSLQSLQSELKNAGFENITWVDVQNPLNISFRWEDRITVILGPKGELSKKIAAAKVMLLEPDKSGITAGDRGTLDLSLYLTNQQMRFRPE